jgi:hypothetical protein
MGTAHECDKLISFPYSQRLGATLAQALETGLASRVHRTRAAESVSCVFPAPQLKREQSLAARFGRADTSYYDISSTWIADGFLSSSPMTPATQWVSMHPFCLGLATTSARAALCLKAGRQPLCQRPSHAPHFWRAVFHSNVSRLRQSCLGRRPAP